MSQLVQLPPEDRLEILVDIGRRVDLDLETGDEGGGEEGEALDVVPMEVRQEDVVEFATVLHQVQPERSQSGTGIEDQALLAVSALERRRITAVTDGLGAGARNGATRSPTACADNGGSCGLRGRRRQGRSRDPRANLLPGLKGRTDRV